MQPLSKFREEHGNITNYSVELKNYTFWRTKLKMPGIQQREYRELKQTSRSNHLSKTQKNIKSNNKRLLKRKGNN